jgi:outer membrane protein insertion porin family
MKRGESMKRSLLIAALIFAVLGLSAQEDWYWGKPIASIQWEGVNHADRKALDGLAKPYVGKSFTQDLWTELQGRVYELEWFDSIDPQAFPATEAKTEVTIKIFVKEKPAVAHVRVTGNSGLHNTEILDVVKTKAGDIYNLQTARLDELAIKRLYLEKGFTDASVTSSVSKPDASGELDLVFAIAEGSKVTVRALRFSGNLALSDKTLKSQLGLKEAGLFQDGSFQESKLEEDKQKLIELYQSRGYIDAAITDVVRKYDKDPKSGKGLLDLTFVIREGRPWVLSSISFEGNGIFSKEKLGVLISQKPGSLVNYQRLIADKQRIDDLYYESGYIFNSIDLVDKRDDEKGTVAYTIRIVERDRAHIESIVFKGNTKSKEKVLYRELPLQVGDVFSKAKIVEGLRNLYNLQYFSSIQPEMRPGSADGLMDLAINVEEQSTADVQFGVTLSGLGDPNAFPVSGLLKWSDKNFLGNGQTFSVELNMNPDDQSLTFSFLDNWLLQQRLTGGVDLSVEHKTTTTPQDIMGPIFADGVPDPFTSYADYQTANFVVPTAYLMPYTTWQFKLGFNTGYGWTIPAGNFGVGLGISSGLSENSYDAEKYRPASQALRDSQGLWLLGNKIAARAYLNALDYWVNPTTGYYASEKVTFAGLLPSPLETQYYIRSDTRVDGFLTLFSYPIFEQWKLKMVLGAHSGFQALVAQPWLGSQPQVLTADALHIDGTFIGRGWHGLAAYDGVQLWENWVELRMPIFESIVWLDGFAEAASLLTTHGLLRPGDATSPYSAANSYAGLAWDNLALSAGFGLRFTIPQFPFRFYFAKRMIFDGATVTYPSTGLDFVISISQPLN